MASSRPRPAPPCYQPPLPAGLSHGPLSTGLPSVFPRPPKLRREPSTPLPSCSPSGLPGNARPWTELVMSLSHWTWWQKCWLCTACPISPKSCGPFGPALPHCSMEQHPNPFSNCPLSCRFLPSTLKICAPGVWGRLGEPACDSVKAEFIAGDAGCFRSLHKKRYALPPGPAFLSGTV